MSTHTRFLLVGCGHIVHAHMDGFQRFPKRASIAAICDPSQSARDQVLSDFAAPETRAYKDLTEALENEQGQVDAVLITTPHWLHFSQVVQCLEAGLPTLVEKPACNTLEEAKQMIEVQERTGTPLMIGQTRRFIDQHIWAREWIHSEENPFGKLRSFNLQASQSVPDMVAGLSDKTKLPWVVDKQLAGGGLVLGVASHLIDLIRFLFDEEFVEVSAWGKSEAPMQNGAESLACVLFRTQSGALGTLHADYMAKKLSYCEAYELIGSEGNLTQQTESPGAYSGPTYYAGNQEPGMLSGFKEVPSPNGSTGLSHFGNQLQTFLDGIQNGDPLPCSIQDNVKTLAVVDAIYRSIEAGGKPTAVTTF